MKPGQSALREVPLSEITPTPHNKRVFHRNEQFRQLCASVGDVGVLQNGVARPHPSGKGVELLAGYRRFRAAQECGLTTMPLSVRDLDDKEAIAFTALENLHREDLTPIEQSETVQSMLDAGWTVQEAADKLGVTPRWVARRARLRALSPRWREALATENHWAATWPAGQLEAIAKLGPVEQDGILDEFEDEGGRPWFIVGQSDGFPSIARLEQYIAREYLRTLDGAPWDLADETLVPEAGACVSCPKRSGAQPLLFGETDPDSKGKTAKDQCADAECYARKGGALAQRVVAQLTVRGRKPLRLYPDNVNPVEAKSLAKAGATTERNYTSAKEGEDGAVQAVIVHGPAAGETRWVRPAGSKGSRASVCDPPKSTPTKPAQKRTQKELEAALEKRRRVWVVNNLRTKLEAIAAGHGGAAGSVSELQRTRPTLECLRYVCAFGTAWNADSSTRDSDGRGRGDDHAAGWPALANLKKADEADIIESLWRHVLRVFVERLAPGSLQWPAGVDRLYADSQPICRALSIDHDVIRRDAEAAIPVPASWAKRDDPKKAKKAAAKPTRKKAAKAAKAVKPKGKPKRHPTPAGPDINGGDARGKKQSRRPAMAAAAK